MRAHNGDHVGMTVILLDVATPTPELLERYLERRIIVLMAGAMCNVRTSFHRIAQASLRSGLPDRRIRPAKDRRTYLSAVEYSKQEPT